MAKKPLLNAQTMNLVRTTDLTWQVLALIRQKDVAYVYLTPDYEVRGATTLNQALQFRDDTPGGTLFELTCKELS